MISRRSLLMTLGLANVLAGCRQTPLAVGLGGDSDDMTPPMGSAVFDSSHDYFPDKVRIQHADGVTVHYGGNYKLVTIRPGGDARLQYRYLLVQRGTPVPGAYPDASVIHVPVKRFTVEIFGGLQKLAEDLHVEDQLVGISSHRGIFPDMPKLAARRAKGLLTEIGGGAGIDLEAVLALRPDLVISDYTGVAGSFEPLARLRVRPFAFANRLEHTPLGCSEWLKVFAMLFNLEREGNALFAGIEERYNALRARARATSASDQPQVLPFRTASDWWQGREIDRQLIRDAGGTAVPPDSGEWQYFRDYPYELVLDTGKHAPVWPFAAIRWKSVRDATKADSRLGQFQAVQDGRLYHPGKLLAPRIVNPFYIAGYLYPDQIVADLIHILHPNLLPRHELRFFQTIPSSPQEEIN